MNCGCSLSHPGNTDWFLEEKELMSRLAVAMRTARNRLPGPEYDNPTVPAGYTYLGQFIAHDLVFSELRRAGGTSTEDLRTAAHPKMLPTATLDLGSLYGHGPDADPHLYVNERGKPHRWRLLLQPMKQPASDEGQPAPPPVQFEHAIGVAKDAMRCPVARGASTALLADPRNDMHLLINQLTVLFAKFHNRVGEWCKAALQAQAEAEGQTKLDESKIYPLTRWLVLGAYHNIVLDDFLKRLLAKSIHRDITHLAKTYADGRVRFPQRSSIVGGFVASRTFASAAFRVGHVMAQARYALSVEHPEEVDPQTGVMTKPGTTLATLLDLTGGTEIEGALFQEWDIEWDRFFFDGETPFTPDGRKRNFSRQIEPTVTTPLARKRRFPAGDDNDGGVVYLDLLRNLGDKLDDADEVIARLYPDLPKNRKLSVTRRKKILQQYFTKTGKALLSDNEIEALSRRMPLLLYVLLEAVAFRNGKRLGPVGGRIVASTLTHALLPNSADTESARREWESLRLPNRMPRTMPELLTFMAEPVNIANGEDLIA